MQAVGLAVFGAGQAARPGGLHVPGQAVPTPGGRGRLQAQLGARADGRAPVYGGRAADLAAVALRDIRYPQDARRAVPLDL